MTESDPERVRLGVGALIWQRLRVWRPRHGTSLFLMAAMTVVLILGVELFQVRDDPKRFAFFLSLYLVFFLVVIGRAVMEIFDIARRHLRERESVFRDTFAADEFTADLGRRVGKADAESWPE